MVKLNNIIGLICVAMFCSAIAANAKDNDPFSVFRDLPYRPPIVWERLRLGLDFKFMQVIPCSMQGFIEFKIVDGVIAGATLWESKEAMRYNMWYRSVWLDETAVSRELMDEKESIFSEFDKEHGIIVNAENLQGSLVSVTGKLEVYGLQVLGVFRDIEKVDFHCLTRQRHEYRSPDLPP